MTSPGLTKALAIAGTNLRRLFRERANIFFLFVLPMLIILLLGAVFGGQSARIGVLADEPGRLGERLADSLADRESVDVVRFGSAKELEDAVSRGQVDAGLVIPAGYERTLRSGGTATLRYYARPDSLAEELRVTVEAAVAEQSAVVAAARFVARESLASFDAGLRRATAAAAVVPDIRVRVVTPEEEEYPTTGGRFDLGASTQLLLFVFLTSLTSAAALIETRRLGISRRMLATPTPARTVILGELLGRLAVALTQALLIMAGSLLLFGVDWGDPAGAVSITLAFSLVGSGAGLLLGSVLANEQQAGAVSLLLGLGLAALGGSMVPLEVFPEPVRAVAHVTPHAWGNDAFSDLLRHGGGLVDVLPEVGVLLAYAAVALSLATWRLRRVIAA